MSGQKRKRTKNTTKEQFELYLHYMESDYHFRSGIISPTLGENYINNQWTKLCNSLNALGDGPNLEVAEWKKRFSDWKYATRAKYRKLMQHRSETGSGPATHIKMTDMEERGLMVWGKVVVTGINCGTVYEGIHVQPMQPIEEHTETADVLPSCESDSNTSLLQEINSNINIQQTSDTVCTAERIVTVAMPEHSQIKTPFKEKGRRIRQKPLSVLAEKLIKVTDSQSETNVQLLGVLQEFSKNYIEVEKEKNDIERQS